MRRASGRRRSWIHLNAVIVQRQIAQDADLAGFDVDLDFCTWHALA